MKRISILSLVINFALALVFAVAITPLIEVNPLITATAITAVSAAAQFAAPSFFSGLAMAGLQKEIWVPGIKENPVPDDTFVYQSTDMSLYVENNKLHLAEAGIEPSVHEDYFAASDDPLPFATVADIPNEVILKTYSTDQTRHRDLQEVELQYDRRTSVINRHRTSLAKNMSDRASFAWSPATANAFNKLMNLAPEDSIIDAIIDIEAFFAGLDKPDNLNICFTPEHMARIKKEDKKLYKEILNEKVMYGLKVFRYSRNPLYKSVWSGGAPVLTKKAYGTTMDAGDGRASFIWASDEVFRAFGDIEMYANLRDSGTQSDTLSFAQRALVGKIRATNPKYLAAITSVVDAVDPG